MTPDDRAMLEKIEAELRAGSREQAGITALVWLHGGMEGWHAACSARRRADPEYQMANTSGHNV